MGIGVPSHAIVIAELGSKFPAMVVAAIPVSGTREISGTKLTVTVRLLLSTNCSPTNVSTTAVIV